jgi:hypothetical protein
MAPAQKQLVQASVGATRCLNRRANLGFTEISQTFERSRPELDLLVGAAEPAYLFPETMLAGQRSIGCKLASRLSCRWSLGGIV